jgi:DNA-binding IclR family transcriptional regulator
MPSGEASGVSLVNSVARALAILDCFEQAERPLGNQDIAQLAGLPKSTVSRITRTLTERRYLHFKPDSETYQLGPRILALANVLQRMEPMSALVQPALQELANATRSTVGFGAIDGLDAVYLNVARGVSMIMLQVDVGTRMPLLGSALGMALLAGAPQEVRQPILAKLQTQMKGEWKSARRRLDAAADEIGKLGYCATVGLWHEDINGVAVPVRLAGDNSVYAINIGVPNFLMDLDKLHRLLAPQLMATIDRLEKRGIVQRVVA